MFECISVQDFKTLYTTTQINVIDVRETHSYMKNHLAHSISIPTTVLPNTLKNLSKDQTYYIVSYNGRRSETIAAFMAGKGFHAVHVIGGMKQIRKAHIAA